MPGGFARQFFPISFLRIIMKARLLLAVIAIAFVAGADDKKEDKKEEGINKELKNLEGKWTWVSTSFQGLLVEGGGEFIITKDKITMKDKDGKDETVNYK